MQKKTELIVFSKKQSRKKDEKYTITLDDKIIEEKTNIKYLGVVLGQFLISYKMKSKIFSGKWHAE